MKLNKKIAALAVAGAMILSGLAIAQSAQAAEITPTGTITLTPTSGNNSDQFFLTGIAVNKPAPAGFQAASSTLIYQGGVEMGAISATRFPDMPATAGVNGLNGSSNPSMDRSIINTNTFVSNKKLNTIATPLATGQFELRYYYFADAANPNTATDPYVKIDLTYNATTGAWSVFTPAIVTTTSLTASAVASTVTLTATVKDGAATATAAAGNVEFFEGATSKGVVAVSSGVATTALTGVADGSHSYTAVFTPSNTVYAASTSAAASVQVGGITATSTITTTIPSGVGTLTLTGVSSTVALGTATLSGGTLNASGTLNAVVTDSRQLDYPAWSLTGQVGDFTAGAKTLSGTYLGWTPAVSGTASGSVAGAVVLPAPGSVSGLKAISTFATGVPSAAGTVTNASALLQLKAPSNTPAGAYSATLTLTLI